MPYSSKSNFLSKKLSLNYQQKRPISFAANPTKFARENGQRHTDPGHVTALLHRDEARHLGRTGPMEMGWGGGGKKLSSPGVTNLPGGQQVRGVHNEGKLDSLRQEPKHYHDHVHFPVLNEKGMAAVKDFENRFGKSGTTYFTTEKSSMQDGRRTANCVGFQEQFVKHLSGVDLGLDVNARPQDLLTHVITRHAEIHDGMRAKGFFDQ